MLREGLSEVRPRILKQSGADWGRLAFESHGPLTLRNKTSAFGNVAAQQNGKKPLPLNDLAASIEVIS